MCLCIGRLSAIHPVQGSRDKKQAVTFAGIMMEIKSLAGTPVEEITQTFNEAFSGYFVHFNATPEYLGNRWEAAGVDYRYSFGAFDKNRLAGFIMMATGTKDGISTAHNAATGAIAAYRGQQLVQRLYEKALPVLSNAGIQQSTLEVITKNIQAIKAYQQIGYRIDKLLHCYSGKVQVAYREEKGMEIVCTPFTSWSAMPGLSRYYMSWEQSDTAVSRLTAQYECWELQEGGSVKAFLILNPQTGTIMSYAFEEGGVEVYGLPLLAYAGSRFDTLKINNVESQHRDVLQLFDKTGLVNHLDQFEMKLMIN